MRLRPIRLALLCRLQSTSRGSSIYQKSLSLLGKDGFTACLCSPTCITGLQEMMKTTRGRLCFCRARKGAPSPPFQKSCSCSTVSFVLPIGYMICK
ncbi:unnamed protein product [Musa acuminata subsp. malaccensis]|uniref:(wild Malaysian banana) hypothetical protein n=1 Tax=Musa acuminata subsp. malaccensis TaxID=214687 RepID=A0A804KUT7_MUSAM|nr:unnamed protein product [Musa acuminata subsp. malaccensis]